MPPCRLRHQQDWHQAPGPQALAWDVNGDGLPDHPRVRIRGDDDGPLPGTVHVLIASPSGGTARTVRLTGKHGFGSVIRSGDFNADGFADLVIADVIFGDLTAFPGTPTGPDRRHPVRLEDGDGGTSVSYLSGVTVADFDQDGYDDVAAAVPRDSDHNGGSVRVIWGGPKGLAPGSDGLMPLREYRISWQVHGFGAELAAGDVTGDGYPDLVETIRPGSARYGARPRLSLMTGGPCGPGAPRAVGKAWGRFAVRDVNGDGFTDVVVPLPGRGGHVLVYRGSRQGLRQPID